MNPLLGKLAAKAIGQYLLGGQLQKTVIDVLLAEFDRGDYYFRPDIAKLLAQATPSDSRQRDAIVAALLKQIDQGRDSTVI